MKPNDFRRGVRRKSLFTRVSAASEALMTEQLFHNESSVFLFLGVVQTNFSFPFTEFSIHQLLSHVQLCDPMKCSMPGFPVHHLLPELAFNTYSF